MASVGIRKRVSARAGRITYQVWWLLDEDFQGAQTVTTPAEARELEAEKQSSSRFREQIGEQAERYQGQRVRIECHEGQRTGFHNVYLDRIGPVPARMPPILI